MYMRTKKRHTFLTIMHVLKTKNKSIKKMLNTNAKYIFFESLNTKYIKKCNESSSH